MSSFKQGYFKPQNPTKYRGRSDNIVYRSSYELKFFMYLDREPEIVAWASEEPFMIVPYRDPVSGRQRRYFPDVWMKKKSGEEFLVEIKPSSQTKPPPRQTNGKVSPKYMRAAATYVINESKWNSAKARCAHLGWKFVIVTERELGIK